MENALSRIADTLAAFVDAARAWLASDAARPENWPVATWVLVGAFLVLVGLLAVRRRAPRGLEVRPPQLLVTHGEVLPEIEVGPPTAGRRRRRVDPVVHAEAGAFVMTVSNLSRYPVQLLEVAVRDDRRGPPRVAPLEALVPALGSVTVEGRLPLGLRGDGWLDLYCYAAAPRVKLHRHRVELVWEPWSARFKAAPLEQTTAPARRLAGDEPSARFLDDVEAAEDVGFVPAPTDGSTLPAAPMAVRAAAPAPAPAPASAAAESAAASDVPRAAPPRPRERPRARADGGAAAAPLAAEGAVRSSPARPTGAEPARAAATPRPPAAARDAAPRGERPVPPPAPTDVPRIATPPVGVAVAGRGGAAARTADGLPIGRPTARPADAAAAASDTTPAARPDVVPAPARAAAPVATPAPSPAAAPPVAPVATSGAPEPSGTAVPDTTPAPARADEAEPAVAPRKRPKLEFPDDF